MNERQPYNLLDKPWIPVAWLPNAADPADPQVGIRTALLRAHQIQCISHTAPFIEFGLYRLLITIVLDAWIVSGRRPTIGKMKQMLEDGRIDACVVDKYFDDHKDRFDLWAGDSPFLQRTPPTDSKKEADYKPVVSMFAAIPSGTNVTHWHHYVEKDENGQYEIKIAECVAAQFLTTVSPFNFKVKPGEARTLAGDPPMYALVLGKNLFETIVLNLPRPSGRITAQQERDAGPSWRTALDVGRLPKVPTATQGFTWPVRIIELENDGATVTKAINQAAYKKPTDKAKRKGGNLYDAKYGWRDPNAGIETAKDSITHIRATLGVPVWRDAIPLFLVASESEAIRGDRRRSRPEVITNALRIVDTPQFRVAVYGMLKKSGASDVKVEEWFRSVLMFPTEVARDSRLSARAFEAFRITQKVADALGTALRMLRAPSEAKKTKKKDTHRGETDALADLWQSLEQVLSRTYLDALESNEPKAEKELWKRVRKEARDAFRRATGPHRRTADGLFRIANASNWLERRLASLLPKPPQEKNS